MSTNARRLALVRHGHSEWNLSNRFTGWSDIPLTATEAATAGKRLKAEDYKFDEAHIPVLQRTRQILDALLTAADHSPIPIFSTWRLNERHYGMLQGMNKGEIFAAWGEENSRPWKRSIHAIPVSIHSTPRFTQNNSPAPKA